MQESWASRKKEKRKQDDNNNNIALLSWSLVRERVTDVCFWTQWLSLKAMVASNWTNYRTICWSSRTRVPRCFFPQTWLWSWLPFNNRSWVRIHYLYSHWYINSSRTSEDGRTKKVNGLGYCPHVYRLLGMPVTRMIQSTPSQHSAGDKPIIRREPFTTWPVLKANLCSFFYIHYLFNFEYLNSCSWDGPATTITWTLEGRWTWLLTTRLMSYWGCQLQQEL